MIADMPSEFRLMGVVNVTPDSFSDGGSFLEADAAIAQGRRLAGEGADLLDVGGESTRPGAEPVDAEPRSSRGCSRSSRPSSPTGKATLSRSTPPSAPSPRPRSTPARDYVNDVTAFRADPRLAGLVADRGVECCLMHMLGEPRTMQDDPRYDDVVSDVKAFLEERLAFAVAEGIREERIALDPGIGFGKTVDHNLELLRRLDEIAAIGRPVVIGHLAQVVPGPDHRPRRDRARARDRRHVRRRVPQRGPRLPRPRGRLDPRCPARDGCYGHRAMEPDDDGEVRRPRTTTRAPAPRPS